MKKLLSLLLLIPSLAFGANIYYKGADGSIIDTGNTNRIQANPSEYFIIGEKSILYFTGASDKDNTAVRCRFSGKLIGDVDR